MIKQRGFHDSQGINFLISFYFFQKLDLSVFVYLEKFQPWYIRSFFFEDLLKEVESSLQTNKDCLASLKCWTPCQNRHDYQLNHPPRKTRPKTCLLKHEMALSTDGTESVCGEYAFPPLLFTPYFTFFIYSAILHTQIIHIIYLVFYLFFVFYVYFMTPSMH